MEVVDDVGRPVGVAPLEGVLGTAAALQSGSNAFPPPQVRVTGRQRSEDDV